MNLIKQFFKKLAAWEKFDPSKIVKIVRPRGQLSRISDWDLSQMITEVMAGKHPYNVTAKIRGITGAHLKQLITKRGPQLGHKPNKVFATHSANKPKISKPPKITDDMTEWDRQLYTSKAEFNTIARRFGFTPGQLKATASPEAIKFFRQAETRRVLRTRAKLQKKAQVKEITRAKKTSTQVIQTSKQQPAVKAPGKKLPSPSPKYLAGTPKAKNEFDRLNVGK